MQTITPTSLSKLLAEGADSLNLLDVRTPGEFERAHIDGARLHPSDDFDKEVVASAFEPEDTLYVICQSGPRATSVGQRLETEGYQQVTLVDGGMNAWSSAGLATNEGKGAIGMDRQMRICAGGLILLGALLGSTLAPAWFGLCAFVGAGLIFAGVTDLCPMTTLIAKLPWNRSGKAASAAMLNGSAPCCGSAGGG